ncbi:MAG: AHH domain-containing protein [Deltaproteobacteria bacterium]|nr:AHH domain-containing protein [Deltaproteobacteria bacterium]
MKATGFYDDKMQIKRGIRRQVTYNKLTNKKEKLSYVNERIELYGFEHKIKDGFYCGLVNFKRGNKPYGNEAHHILSCDLFYDDAWTDKHLTVVKECGYDINNEGNIIYLPTEHLSCFYHDLPNHLRGHPQYNDKVKRFTTKVLNKADKAIDEECDEEKEKLMKELFDMLISIEDIMYKFVTKKGRRSLSPKPLPHKKGRK